MHLVYVLHNKHTSLYYTDLLVSMGWGGTSLPCPTLYSAPIFSAQTTDVIIWPWWRHISHSSTAAIWGHGQSRDVTMTYTVSVTSVQLTGATSQ